MATIPLNLTDKVVHFSVGKSRKDINWRQTKCPWNTFAQYFTGKGLRRTSETFEEYQRASKDERSNIKDVGGFVGGIVENGRRVKGSVKERTMLTLDIDEGSKNFPEIWSKYCKEYNLTSVYYTTHSHTPENPRYRLIIPLSRNVDVDEHEALARIVADEFGIDMFDDTTYQAERLMYYPSASSDAEYISEVSAGDFLDVDDKLAEFEMFGGDIHDKSTLPHSSRVQTLQPTHEAKDKTDPTEIKGVIGAFCRTYGIADAIATFLSDIYEPTSDPNRYTFVGGSTSGGLVVYDDKFAFSHHSTDPASGQMCNAYDLVRIHKYGHYDTDKSLPFSSLPSNKFMENFANKDKRTNREIIAETYGDDVLETFDEMTDDDEPNEVVPNTASVAGSTPLGEFFDLEEKPEEKKPEVVETPEEEPEVDETPEEEPEEEKKSAKKGLLTMDDIDWSTVQLMPNETREDYLEFRNRARNYHSRAQLGRMFHFNRKENDDYGITSTGVRKVLSIFQYDPPTPEGGAKKPEFITAQEQPCLDVSLAKQKGKGGQETTRNIVANYEHILEHAKSLKGLFAYNTFSGEIEITRTTPTHLFTRGSAQVTDEEDYYPLYSELELKFPGLGGQLEKLRQAVSNVCRRHAYDPLHKYLCSVHKEGWDGTPRMETFFHDYLGAEDDDLHRELTKRFFNECIARGLEPGCNVAGVIVLRGAQGIGKSSIIQKLCPDPKWFNDSMTDISGKDAMQNLQGSWLIEWGELSALKHSDAEQFKNFVTIASDKYRAAYARQVVERPRRCVFFATTNERYFIKDATGSRRFWVFDCKEKPTKTVWKDLTPYERDQIWAEAIEHFESDPEVFCSKEIEEQYQEYNKQFTFVDNDPRIGQIKAFLDIKLPVDWNTRDENGRISYLTNDFEIERDGTYVRDTISVPEIIAECFRSPKDNASKNAVYTSTEICNLLDRIGGWHKAKKKEYVPYYGNQIVYKRNI